jgi:glycosyltransferase involved in cell wall biosynthesis
MRVTCLVKRWNHHTASGGYDRLAAAVGATVITRKQIPGLFGRVANKVWWHLTNKYYLTADYQIGDWLAEIHALTTSFFKPPDVIHVLYSKQASLLLKWRKMLRCPLIVTFHGPAERFNTSKGLGIDIAVVVAASQIEIMQRFMAPHKIAYIPHGIDTDRFRPDDQMLDPDKMRILIVGEHMRDWLVIHRTIDEVNHRALDIEFHVVTSERYFPYLNGCANVTYHSQISETELINLYRQSDVLFLPVTNATANNSILEALACGTPVISTRVGGMPDYVNDESGWLLPIGDIIGHVNLIELLHDNRELARGRRQAARNQALKFDWRRVAEQMVALYSDAVRSQQYRSTLSGRQRHDHEQ